MVQQYFQATNIIIILIIKGNKSKKTGRDGPVFFAICLFYSAGLALAHSATGGMIPSSMISSRILQRCS